MVELYTGEHHSLGKVSLLHPSSGKRYVSTHSQNYTVSKPMWTFSMRAWRLILVAVVAKSEAFTVTESKIPRFLEIRLIDVGEVVSLTRRPRFTPYEDSWYSFLLEASQPQGHSAAGINIPIEKIK
jgi:hypothetical protein